MYLRDEEQKFLGYMVMAEGIKSDPGKVQGGDEWPRGRSTKGSRKEVEGQILKKFSDREIKCCENRRRMMKGHLDSTRNTNRVILEDLEGKEYSHAIRLNFHASDEDMNYEALLSRLIASGRRGMKDLHVFVGSKFLVDQVEWNRVPRTEEAKRYREETMDATTPFYRFQIAYLPNALNLKAEALTGLASIRLEFLNQ
ncbi:reverse transcriptase domain-containing protein [Tanacetum coccineum]